jgi:pyridoxal phosphate enzyme (YggS family)
MLIAQRLQQIRASLPPQVRIIGVTKQVAPELMRQAYQAGIRDFAESRLQEALPKMAQLQDLPDVTWHFIGHIQTNKARKVLEHFSSLQAVDSLKLAQRLQELATELAIFPRVYLQVKPCHDPQKYGWEIPQLLKDLPELKACEQLKFQGLMTILPLGLEQAEQLAAFQAVRELRDRLGTDYALPLAELSMGMSADYPLAVQAGATEIRLGRILFGERPTPLQP